MWIMFDMFCCMVFILYLVVIFVDCYWVVINIDYVWNRSVKIIFIMIVIVWFVGFCILMLCLLGW